jgi:hypothetical protein
MSTVLESTFLGESSSFSNVLKLRGKYFLDCRCCKASRDS